MPDGLKRKVGPLPLWGWVLIAGGTIGGALLWRKAKGKEAAEQGEPIPEHLAAGLPEVGGGGGAGASPEDSQLRQELGEAKGRLEGESLSTSSPGSTTATPVSDFLTTEHELEAGGWQRAQAEPPPGATGSTAPVTVNSLSAAKGGQPGRGGVLFKAGAYKGHAAHVYARAVPGGVGPGHNVIVLNPSHGSTRTAHSKAPNHAPAKAKPHTQKPKGHSPPARPVVHQAPKRKPSKPKPKPNYARKAKGKARF